MTMGSNRFHRLVAGATLLLLAGAAAPLLLTWRTPPEPAVPAAPDAAAVAVDLKGSVTPADLARLEQESGLDLQENSVEYPVDHLMRADVPPSQQAAALAT